MHVGRDVVDSPHHLLIVGPFIADDLEDRAMCMEMRNLMEELGK
jgi:hypothetical protein